MAKDYAQIAHDVLVAVGGKENITHATHCMTRLRFNLKDDAVPVDDEVKKIKGVLGVQRAGGQYQVIIGQDVAEPYALLCKEAGIQMAAPVDENLDVDASKQSVSAKSVINGMLDYLSGSIVPVIPILMVSGLFKTVQVLLGPMLFGVISEADGIYQFLNMAFNAGFYFLPIYLGYIAANKAGATPVLGMMLGGLLLEPSFVQMVSDGGVLNVLGADVQMVSYGQSVLPIILCVWIMARVEKFFKKVVPDSLKSVFAPFLTMVVMMPLSLMVVAPLGSILGEFVGNAFFALGSRGGIISVIALAALCTVQPFLVVTGMHMVLVALGLSTVATYGSDPFVLTANVMSNYALWGVAFGTFLRMKNATDKSDALGFFVSGFLGGVCEPILFGLCLARPRAFLGGAIGGAVAGLLSGIGGVALYQVGVSSFMSIFCFMGEGGPSFVWACIAALAGFVVSAAVTYFFSYTKEEIEGAREA